MTTPPIADVLVQHQFRVTNVQPGSRWVGCTCGWEQPEDNHNAQRHADHVAAILDAREAELRAEVEGLRSENALQATEWKEMFDTAVRYKRERNEAIAERDAARAQAQTAARDAVLAAASALPANLMGYGVYHWLRAFADERWPMGDNNLKEEN